MPTLGVIQGVYYTLEHAQEAYERLLISDEEYESSIVKVQVNVDKPTMTKCPFADDQ